LCGGTFALIATNTVVRQQGVRKRVNRMKRSSGKRRNSLHFFPFFRFFLFFDGDLEAHGRRVPAAKRCHVNSWTLSCTAALQSIQMQPVMMMMDSCCCYCPTCGASVMAVNFCGICGALLKPTQALSGTDRGIPLSSGAIHETGKFFGLRRL
jgi:hypothetical protein